MIVWAMIWRTVGFGDDSLFLSLTSNNRLQSADCLLHVARSRRAKELTPNCNQVATEVQGAEEHQEKIWFGPTDEDNGSLENIC